MPQTRTRLSRTPLTLIIVGLLLCLPLYAVPAHAEPSRAELDDAIAQLAELEADNEALIEEYNGLVIKLDESRDALAKAKTDYANWSEEAAAAQTEVSERVADLYTSGLDSRLEAFFGSGDFNDFSDRVAYLSAITDDGAEIAADATVAQQRADWAKDAAAKAEADIEKQQAELEAKKKEIEERLDKQEDLVAKLRVDYEQAMEAWRASQVPETPTGGGGPPTDPGGDYDPPPTSSAAAIAVSTAKAQVGKPYRYGAGGPDAFDCSGLTSYAWNAAGVYLPHQSLEQYNSTPRVSQSDLRPGDLVFFDTDGDGVINHVGIMVSSTTMVHADNPQSGVNYSTAISYIGYVGAGRPG